VNKTLATVIDDGDISVRFSSFFLELIDDIRCFHLIKLDTNSYFKAYTDTTIAKCITIRYFYENTDRFLYRQNYG
jgi:phage FluMu protein Com